MNLVFGTLSTAIHNLSELGAEFFVPGGMVRILFHEIVIVLFILM